jgi:hypothetical protein
MRGVPVLLAFLLAAGALASLPAGQAQAASINLLEDSSGDIQTMVAGNPLGPPAGRFAATDLVGLSVEETSSDIVFRLAVGSVGVSPEAPFAESTMYTVDFAHVSEVYRVMMYRMTTGASAAQYGGRLYSFDEGRDTYTPLERLVVSADASTNTVSAAVPRVLLLDQQGAAPFPGRVLAGFWAQSASMGLSDRPIPFPPDSSTAVPDTGVRDAMPNEGVGPLDFMIRLGLQQSGAARLSALTPVRSSNGEATTFVFPVNASNFGPAQRFQVRAVGAPPTWQVDLPSALVELAANSTQTLPVLVSMPFAHQHGTLSSFTVEMVGLDRPDDIGRVQLGVRFVQPPQPAGHHDTQYLHTFGVEGDQTFTTVFSTLFGFDPNQMYFNTLTPDEDPNDAKAPVGGFSLGGIGTTVPPQTTYLWTVPLSPGLALGLDFDLLREGAMKVAVNTVVPMTGAVLSGRVVHTIPDSRNCDGGFGRDRDDCQFDDFFFGAGAHITAATIGPGAPQDVGANTNGALFEAPIRATPAGDYIPFHPDATLGLQLNLTFTTVDPFIGPDTAPKVAGGELVLPLLEYHDPVDQVFSSLSSLMIHVRGDQERLVNPGKTAVFDLELMNHAAETASFDLELTGTGSSWARILGDRRVTLPGGSSRALGIAVTAPADAADGQSADLVFAAVDTSDPAARTLARLVTTVDTEAEHRDDSALVPGLSDALSKKGSPGAGLPLAVVALAALAVAFARRR